MKHALIKLQKLHHYIRKDCGSQRTEDEKSASSFPGDRENKGEQKCEPGTGQ